MSILGRLIRIVGAVARGGQSPLLLLSGLAHLLTDPAVRAAVVDIESKVAALGPDANAFLAAVESDLGLPPAPAAAPAPAS